MPEGNYSESPTLFADPPDGSEGTWDNYQSLTQFPTDDGIMVLPVAGPDGTPPVVIKTHAKIAFKSVSWSAMKSGRPPGIPCPEPADSNEVLLSSILSPATPKLQTNGLSHIWSIAGTYNYVLMNPLAPCSKGLPSGGDPGDKTPAAYNVYPADKFRHDLLTGTGDFTE